LNYLWRYLRYTLGFVVVAPPVLVCSAIALIFDWLANQGWEMLDYLLFGRFKHKGW